MKNSISLIATYACSYHIRFPLCRQIVCSLIHRGHVKMAEILHTTISNLFTCMDIVLRFHIYLKVFPGPVNNNPTLVQIMAWCQCWLSLVQGHQLEHCWLQSYAWFCEKWFCPLFTIFKMLLLIDSTFEILIDEQFFIHKMPQHDFAGFWKCYLISETRSQYCKGI